MPKLIELTVEINVQRVSCPGVWLCQDGRVSLTVFALGTSYQTCLLPPVFPLNFKDVFYFRKRFQETCTLNNICCLLKEEMIYCELVQWCEDCASDECKILAQYLGTLNDVLFPPNLCTADGVDLLMRRSKDFPGILSPKIEIATKVRLDEVWNQESNFSHTLKFKKCNCVPPDGDGSRQKQVCHSAQYHRRKCNSPSRRVSPCRSRSRSRSVGSHSCCSFAQKPEAPPKYPSNPPPSRSCLRPRCPRATYNVYNMANPDTTWCDVTMNNHGRTEEYVYDDYYDDLADMDDDDLRVEDSTDLPTPNLDRIQKLVLESRYIDQDIGSKKLHLKRRKLPKEGLVPCVCDICKRYHELFHLNNS